MTLQPGQTILNGKFRIERLLGRGAFGEVYLVTHLRLNASRAVKVLRRDTPGVGSQEFAIYRDRFDFEAQLGARLDHLHVVKVYDFEEADGELYLVMEYCTGGSLADHLAEHGPLSVADAIQLGLDLCDGLAILHEKVQAIHRDIKPSNILFGADGRVKISDLGLAQAPGSDSRRTLLGSLAGEHPGTPAYMSPEQETSTGYLLPTSDLFALGCVLFEALTGKVYKTVYGAALRDLRPDAPAWLAAVVARALKEAPGRLPEDEADPGKRYRSARQMRAELAAGLAAEAAAPPSSKITPRPRWLPVIILAGVAPLIIVIWMLTRLSQAPSVARATEAFTAALTEAPALATSAVASSATLPSIVTPEPVAKSSASPTADPTPIATPESVTPTATVQPESPSPTPIPQGIFIRASPTLAVVLPEPLEPSTLFIEYLIDASSGMMQPWTQNTEPKLASIQRVLPVLWQDDAGAMNIGLRVYGHHRSSTDPRSCDDVELLRPVRQWAPNDLITSLFSLRAQGLDSSTTALRDAYGDFQYKPGGLNALIFLAEGGDTCGGNPLSIIEAQKEIGVVLPVFVVALEPEASSRSGLQSIATQSGGQYFEVNNPSELYETLHAIIEALIKAAP